MKCEDYSKMMTDLLAGELSDNDKTELDSHLAGCDSCTKEFEDLQKTWNLVAMSLKKEDLNTDNLDVGEIEKEAAKEKPGMQVQDTPARGKAKPGIIFFDFRMMLKVAALVFFCVAVTSLFILPALKNTNKESQVMVDCLGGDASEPIRLAIAPSGKMKSYEPKMLEKKSKVEKLQRSSDRPSSTAATDEDTTLSMDESAPSFAPPAEAKQNNKTEYGNALSVDGHASGYGAGWNKNSKKAESSAAATALLSRPPNAYPPANSPAKSDSLRARDISNNEAREKAKDYNEKAAPSNAPAIQPAAVRVADIALPEVKMDPKTIHTSFQPKFKPVSKESLKKSVGGFGQAGSDKSSVAGKEQGEFKKESVKRKSLENEQTEREEAPAEAPAEDSAADVVEMPEIKPSESHLVLPGLTAGRKAVDGKTEAKSKEATGKLRQVANEDAAMEQEEMADSDSESQIAQKDEGKAVGYGYGLGGEKKPQSSPVELITKTYEVNLKLWDMTDEKTAREFLKSRNAKFAGISEIKIDLMNGKITLKVPQSLMEETDRLFEELRRADEKMKENKDGLPFIDTKQKPFSTFSIDVDTASYTMAAKLIRQGNKPDPDSIRPEEFINYFDYHYSPPKEAVFGISLEASPSPFRPENCLFRIGVKAKVAGAESGKGSALTFVIDASGSMARDNRLELIKKKLPRLFEQLGENDRITVIVSRETPQIIVNNIRAADSKTVEMLIDDLRPAGVANLETGIVAAYDSAFRTYVPGAYNRVVIITDGISNIGSSSPEVVLGKADFARRRGITNTVLAVGGDGDDRFLEAIADKGDGNYVFISDEVEAERIFTNEFAAIFHEIARDVKIQVEFRAETVAKYRQIGYQNRQLSKADFRNDSVDAGEVGSGQSVTALYEMILDRKRILASAKIAGSAPEILAVVRIRYRSVETMEIEEREFFLDTEMVCASFEKTNDGFKLAASVAEFAEYLEFPDVPNIAGPQTIRNIVSPLISSGLYSGDSKAREFYSLSTMVN